MLIVHCRAVAARAASASWADFAIGAGGKHRQHRGHKGIRSLNTIQIHRYGAVRLAGRRMRKAFVAILRTTSSGDSNEAIGPAGDLRKTTINKRKGLGL